MAETRMIVRLKRGRKKAVLTLNGGYLFRDMALVEAGLRIAARDGWTSWQIEHVYADSDGKTTTRWVDVELPIDQPPAAAGGEEGRA